MCINIEELFNEKIINQIEYEESDFGLFANIHSEVSILSCMLDDDRQHVLEMIASLVNRHKMLNNILDNDMAEQLRNDLETHLLY
jgi:hypothetical protein